MIPSNKTRCWVAVSMLLYATIPFAQQADSAVLKTAEAPQPAAQTFSQQDLDQLLAPIALYPDPLLAQILMASSYPLEVVLADRWVKANPKVTGKKLEDAMAKQSWDPAVKALAAVPQVLKLMSEKVEWTQRLGDAFLAQQKDVMESVQRLRAKAYAAGNLKSTEQQVVKAEAQGSTTIYVVQSAKPEVVYVPVYNPTVVYGTWWYSVPPYYLYPPTYVYPPGLAFATGVVVGAAIWGNCHWGHGNNHVNINVSHYNSFNRTKITNNTWNHNVEHRRGVAYFDNETAKRFDSAKLDNRPKSLDRGAPKMDRGNSLPGPARQDRDFDGGRMNIPEQRKGRSPMDTNEFTPRADFPGRGPSGPMGGAGPGLRERN